jgi:hypothetical protein
MPLMSLGSFTIAFPKANLPKMNMTESALSGMLEEQCRFSVDVLLIASVKVTFGTVI